MSPRATRTTRATIARSAAPQGAQQTPSRAGERSESAPLISLLPFQSSAFWGSDDFGLLILLWRRQAGKTHTLSALALRRMMETPGRLVTYASASLAMGAELTIKESALWQDAVAKSRETLVRETAETWQHNLALWRESVGAAHRIESNADNVDLDGLCDLLDRSKMEVKLWHTNTIFSRTKIIAPNPATARSYSGFVMIDEIGFIRDMKDLWEAMEPIASRQPDFRVVMATTPPSDDGHYSFELTVPPEGWQKPAHNPAGHWYDSQANIRVHYLDAYDADLAGVHFYDSRTRKPLSVEDARAKSLDRDAFDRNYLLRFTRGGICALSLLSLQRAMASGRGLCLYAENDFPPGWSETLGSGPVSIGVDPATTTNEKSNPTGLCVMEDVAGQYIPRLLMRYKSADPDEHRAFIKEAVDGATRVRNGRTLRPRALCLDATNERLFCADLRKDLAGQVPTYLLVSSEKYRWGGEDVPTKEYLGNQLVNHIDDGRVPLPDVRAVKDDFRLVTKERGRFVNILDSAGNHGDMFDGAKNALHGLVVVGGPVEATPCQVGAYNLQPSERPDFMHPDHSSDNPAAKHGAMFV